MVPKMAPFFKPNNIYYLKINEFEAKYFLLTKDNAIIFIKAGIILWKLKSIIL